MKTHRKRFISFILVGVLGFVMLPTGVLTVKATSTISTGDIIEYGSYPQSKVIDATLLTTLNLITPDNNSNVTYNDATYKRVYFTSYTPYYNNGPHTSDSSYQDDNGYYTNNIYWFKYEPIQWRVLSNTNGELFVMAEKLLASRAYLEYYTVGKDVDWETCTVRKWLNNDFYNDAFNSTEQTKIIGSSNANDDNPFSGIDGGPTTYDKLFLPSYSEIVNSAYGFNSDYNSADTTRQAQGTDYSKCNGLHVINNIPGFLGLSDWWLRSPGGAYACAGYVNLMGSINYNNSYIWYADIGVRPALKINLSSVIYFMLDKTMPTNDNVTANIIYPLDATTKEYKIDEGTWTAYTAPIVLSTNVNVYARCKDSTGNISGTGSVVINNIDKEAPTTPIIMATPTKPTDCDVSVAISYPVDVATKEYNIDGSTWTAYTTPLLQTNNCIIYARCIDAVGNISDTASISINNIIKPIAKNGSSAIVNQNNHLIYGLDDGLTLAKFKRDYISVSGNGNLVYTLVNGSFGTGTKADLIDNATNEIIATYTILIFGDVNGDGNIDSIDAGKFIDYQNYMVNWDPITDSAFVKAGDLNGDGNIDSIDAGLAVDFQNYLVTINQSTGIALPS